MKDPTLKQSMRESVTLTEYYNKEGICVKRMLGDMELEADTEPTVQFFMADVATVSQKTYLAKEEAISILKE